MALSALSNNPMERPMLQSNDLSPTALNQDTLRSNCKPWSGGILRRRGGVKPGHFRGCKRENGRLEIDNLIAERALRGVAIGRRNWLFAGSKAGGERAAAIYTIIETCKLNGVEPFAYISCVMQKIAEGWPNSRIDELLPWAWSPVAQQKAA